MNKAQQTVDTVIVGLGKTGLSVARFLEKQERSFAVVDSRKNPPNAGDLSKYTPRHFGGFSVPWLLGAKELVVNPGIAISTPEITAAKEAGVTIIGDVELFAREAKKPVVAITGSNGKTTVTALLDLMAKKSGVQVGTGGNIGTPALDLLNDESTELFILELSSYQLDTTSSLQTLAAVILNISEDHLDRYDNNLEKYAESKAVIYQNCEYVVYNRDDAYSMKFAERASGQNKISFGLGEPQDGHYGLRIENEIEWLTKGKELLMSTSEIKQVGRHNVSNSLATLALGEVAGLKVDAMLSVLREYPGMDHRTQWLAERNGVNWYNDSKGTNVGATLAALSGLAGKTVLIAGGQGKGADFSPLQRVIKEKARAVILMGEDAKLIAQFVDNSIPTVFVNSMHEAVIEAEKLAQGDYKDNVLLSPACASFDMFDNYMVRGDMFIQEVNQLKEDRQGGTHV